MNSITTTVEALELGEAMTYGSLTMFPLLGPLREPDYATLDEALASGFLRIEELSQGGSVPELRAINRLDRRVLLVDGEELIGAKQNRILNLSVLMAANITMTIPVSCVEAGRWSHVSKHFSSADRTQFARGRANKQRDVTNSMQMDGSRRSEQGRVWADISDLSNKMETLSRTGAMSAVFEKHAVAVDEYVARLTPIPLQVGAVFSMGGGIVGMDLFDAQATFAGVLPKLVRSYALEATREAPASTSSAAARGFLDEVARAPTGKFPAVGLGEDIRLRSATLTGAALVEAGRVVHFSAFRVEADHQEDGRRGGRMARPAFRARAHVSSDGPAMGATAGETR